MTKKTKVIIITRSELQLQLYPWYKHDPGWKIVQKYPLEPKS